MIDEIDRVSETTKFNEIYLLKGASTEVGTTDAVAVMKDSAKQLAEASIGLKTGAASVYGAGETDAVTADAGAAGVSMALDTTALGQTNYL